LGDLAREIVENNKKLCSLELLVLFVQAKRTEENECQKVLGHGAHSVFRISYVFVEKIKGSAWINGINVIKKRGV
jgi:hypothetical protein